MRERGRRPTLGELRRTTPWVWLWCERCQHHAPLACAVAVNPVGTGSLKATGCAPSHAAPAAARRVAGNHIGFYPFPSNANEHQVVNTRSQNEPKSSR